jgi:hypothetical protein
MKVYNKKVESYEDVFKLFFLNWYYNNEIKL